MYMNSAINSQEKTVSALWFKGLLQAATSLQLQQSELLKASGVSEDELAHPYDRLSLQKNQKLWRAIESSSRLANIGLRIGEMVKSEEHTSELQSRPHLVCRLLL